MYSASKSLDINKKKKTAFLQLSVPTIIRHDAGQCEAQPESPRSRRIRFRRGNTLGSNQSPAVGVSPASISPIAEHSQFSLKKPDSLVVPELRAKLQHWLTISSPMGSPTPSISRSITPPSSMGSSRSSLNVASDVKESTIVKKHSKLKRIEAIFSRTPSASRPNSPHFRCQQSKESSRSASPAIDKNGSPTSPSVRNCGSPTSQVFKIFGRPISPTKPVSPTSTTVKRLTPTSSTIKKGGSRPTSSSTSRRGSPKSQSGNKPHKTSSMKMKRRENSPNISDRQPSSTEAKQSAPINERLKKMMKFAPRSSSLGMYLSRKKLPHGSATSWTTGNAATASGESSASGMSTPSRKSSRSSLQKLKRLLLTRAKSVPAPNTNPTIKVTRAKKTPRTSSMTENVTLKVRKEMQTSKSRAFPEKAPCTTLLIHHNQSSRMNKKSTVSRIRSSSFHTTEQRENNLSEDTNQFSKPNLTLDHIKWPSFNSEEPTQKVKVSLENRLFLNGLHSRTLVASWSQLTRPQQPKAALFMIEKAFRRLSLQNHVVSSIFVRSKFITHLSTMPTHKFMCSERDHAKFFVHVIKEMIQNLDAESEPIMTRIREYGKQHIHLIPLGFQQQLFESFGLTLIDVLALQEPVKGHRHAAQAWNLLISGIVDALMTGYGDRRASTRSFNLVTND